MTSENGKQKIEISCEKIVNNPESDMKGQGYQTTDGNYCRDKLANGLQTSLEPYSVLIQDSDETSASLVSYRTEPNYSTEATNAENRLSARTIIIPCHEVSYARRLQTNFRKRQRNLELIKAFETLKLKIPNIPVHSKISKIQILRLAIAYINFLSGLIQVDDLMKNNQSLSNFQVEEKQDRKEFKADPKLISGRKPNTQREKIEKEIWRHNQVMESSRTNYQNQFSHENVL